MPDLTTKTLGELLSHTNETIRRNAISIYKTLIGIDKRMGHTEICPIYKEKILPDENGNCSLCGYFHEGMIK